MFNILVVEDNKIMRDLVKTYLTKNNYNVYEAIDGEKALKVLETSAIDLIVSDIMMPNMNGYELTQELRSANFQIPILMITAKDTIEDKKEGFSIGADDYMVKPADMDEMILRIQALLRRSKAVNEKKLEIGQTILDYSTLSIKKGDATYDLKPKEFYILYKFLSYPNKIFTRQDLMEEFWGFESESDPRTVDTHIKRIREKTKYIEDFEIETIRGLGYRGVIK